VWVKVEQRDHPETAGIILGSAGPAEHQQEAALSLSVDGVTNGDNRYIVAEVRESASPTDRVLYYGISESFSLTPGRHVHVDVPMKFQVPQVELHEPVVALRFDGDAPARVSLALARNATVHLEMVDAVEVTLANDPSFDIGRTVLTVGETDDLACRKETKDQVAWDVCEYAGWDLLEGVWDETGDLATAADGEYSLFARFRDRYGYESEVHKATVTVDATPPAVAVAELSRPSAGAEQPVYLTVTFLEAVRDGEGELAEVTAAVVLLLGD